MRWGYAWGSATLNAETFQMMQRPLILVLPRQRQNGEAGLKTSESLIYSDIHYITNSLCKNVLKEPDTVLGYKLHLLNNF
jgi:hypothetical protein